MHPHLAHLARVHCGERYERYQVGRGWQYVDNDGPMTVLEGQFIILRPLDLTDRSCVGLSSLIRRLHRRWDTANLSRSTVPERYRMDPERDRIPRAMADERGDRDEGDQRDEVDEEEEEVESEEEGSSNSSESSGGDDMWAEELY